MEMMHAMQIDAPRRRLRRVERPMPIAGDGEILIEVLACGVCRTDLHIADGDISGHLPIIPGHEVIGRVVALGNGVEGFPPGDRVGVPWLGHTCGVCRYCCSGHENLCDAPLFTGFTRDGGYASHCIADAAYCFAIPDIFDNVHAAPLLCAGLIGYRSLVMAGDTQRIGFYGFGAAAHILAQIAVWQGREVFAFTRQGDDAGQAFARSLGCVWAGASIDPPPQELDAAIIFAAAGGLVPVALRAVHKGGRVVCAGIHMSDIPSFPYAYLWGERSVQSVANLTRADGAAFFDIAARVPVRTSVTVFPLEQANEALTCLRKGVLAGAAVLTP